MKYIIYFIFFCFCTCWGNLKIAFISDKSLLQANTAIFNGARNTAKELSKTIGKKIEISFIDASTVNAQNDAISKAFVDGYVGAIVYPISTSEISAKASSLKKSGFVLVSVGKECSDNSVLCSVITDNDIRASLIENVIKKRSKFANKVACYFKGSSSESVSLEDSVKIKTLLNADFNFQNFQKVFGGRDFSIDVIDFYSVYADANKIDIMRRDNYGEVFFSPKILSNMQPITPDTDRLFSLCIGGLPMLEFYFATGALSDCVYDDYYGWGVFALRSIIDSKVSNADVIKVRKLRPIHASKENYSIFVSDWRKWLR